MSALDAGVSGMLAEQTRMDTVGNNIANSNTTGYKSTDVLFADALAQVIEPGTAPTSQLGGTDPMAIGQGVLVTGSNTDFSQGTLQATGRTLDIAVEGDGFLPVTDGTQIYYTRNGSLGLDANGNLVQLASGLKVVALPAAGTAAASAPAGSTGGASGGSATSSGSTGTTGASGGTAPSAASAVNPQSTLQIPLGQASIARATSEVRLGGNLDARLATGGQYQVSASVYDSLGTAHNVTLTFTRSGTAGTWNVSATSPDGTATPAAPAQVTFDANGMPTGGALSLQLAYSGSSGATSPQSISLSLANVTQLAQGSSVALRAQDGAEPGSLTGLSIGSDGSILGVYSNGMQNPLGQLVTTQFSNNNGLQSVRNSLFQATANSGTPAFGAPGSQGRGAVRSGQLEASNVNLAQEFADMIVTQKGFQASSRVVTTADQMLQVLMSIGQ